jgi:hypothetical protein
LDALPPERVGLHLSFHVVDTVGVDADPKTDDQATRGAPAGVRRLAAAVRERRSDLGYARGDLGNHGGPGVVTVGKIERGEIPSPQAGTLRKLDVSLQWNRGTAASFLSGSPSPGRAITPVADTDVVVTGSGEGAGDQILLRVPPGLTPRQRERAKRLGEASVRAYLESLDDEDEDDA